MINCSIVIVNYNTGDILNQVVSKIINSPVVDKIVVVDNCSTDNSMDLLKTHSKLEIHLRKQNHGFAKSCNYGATCSSSNSILFLNPDCYIENDGLVNLIDDLEKNTNSGVIGCMVKNPDGTEQRASRRRLPTLIRAIKTFTGIEKLAKYCHCFAGVNLIHQPLKQQTHFVEAISGALILIKTSVFNEINGFDESYPMHFEDLDLFKRCQDSGYSIMLNPIVEAVHYQGVSSLSNPLVEQFKKLGLQRYFYKHCSYFSYLIIKTMNKLLWTKL
jgi:GT2 family glycosyltransferase